MLENGDLSFYTRSDFEEHGVLDLSFNGSVEPMYQGLLGVAFDSKRQILSVYRKITRAEVVSSSYSLTSLDYIEAGMITPKDPTIRNATIASDGIEQWLENLKLRPTKSDNILEKLMYTLPAEPIGEYIPQAWLLEEGVEGFDVYYQSIKGRKRSHERFKTNHLLGYFSNPKNKCIVFSGINTTGKPWTRKIYNYQVSEIRPIIGSREL